MTRLHRYFKKDLGIALSDLHFKSSPDNLRRPYSHCSRVRFEMPSVSANSVCDPHANDV